VNPRVPSLRAGSLAAACLAAALPVAAFDGSSPTLDSLGGRSDPPPSPAAAAPSAAQAAADPRWIILHCRPEVLEAFLKLYTDAVAYNSRRSTEMGELALTIDGDPDGGYRFAPAPRRRSALCQSAAVSDASVAVAHTHPKAGAVQEPVGADCDSRMPNYVITHEAIYVTNAHQGGRRFQNTGDSGDLGTYRTLLDSGWRHRENWTNERWLRRCAVDAVESLERRDRSRRCYYDPAQAAEYRRRGRAPDCAAAE
jgi:hypothetical protein